MTKSTICHSYAEWCSLSYKLAVEAMTEHENMSFLSRIKACYIYCPIVGLAQEILCFLVSEFWPNGDTLVRKLMKMFISQQIRRPHL